MDLQKVLLDVQQLGSNPFTDLSLHKTVKIECLDQEQQQPMSQLLAKCYQQDSLCFLACLINATITQHRPTFVLSYPLMSLLLAQDPNLLQKSPDVKEITLTQYQQKILLLVEGQFLQALLKLNGTHEVLVLQIVHPELLSYFYTAMGMKNFLEQKAYVLQLASALWDFEAQSKNSLPVILPNIPTSSDYSSHSSNESFAYYTDGELLQLDFAGLNSLVQELDEKHKHLQELARISEDYRLKDPDNKNLILQAVNDAIGARKLQRYLENIQWAIIKVESSKSVKAVKAAKKVKNPVKKNKKGKSHKKKLRTPLEQNI